MAHEQIRIYRKQRRQVHGHMYEEGRYLFEASAVTCDTRRQIFINRLDWIYIYEWLTVICILHDFSYALSTATTFTALPLTIISVFRCSVAFGI